MEIYITLKNELVLTNSKEKKRIERDDLDQIKLHWLKIKKQANLWEVEEFNGDKRCIVAKSLSLSKLLVPFMRRVRFLFGRLPIMNEQTLANWVDKNK